MRSYGHSFRPRLILTPAVKALAIVTAGVFLLQILFRLEEGDQFIRLFALSLYGLRRARIWQLVTYVFLHDGFLHILFNMLLLVFMGPEIERVMGRKRFVLFYLGCGGIAGIAWLALERSLGAVCIGASGAVFGILGAFAAFFPERRISFFVFPFPFPITLKAKVLAAGLAGLSFLMLQVNRDGKIADSAHLGGIIAGYAYARALRKEGILGQSRNTYSSPRPPPFRPAWGEPRLRILRPDEPEPGPTPAQIDAILDKIAKKGIGSLSREERRILKKASTTM